MTDAPPPFLADGRFEIVRRLGEGGMGSVWLARDCHLGGRLVAVKVLSAHLSSGALLNRFRREARIMAKLRHPGLIDVYDVCLTGPAQYIAQEYVEGSDLAALLKRSGPLPPASVRRLARELAQTLAYLHGQGIVHRDMKPANVMIQSDGRSRVADLGLALAGDCTRLTQEGSLVGTVLYMAPEAVRGEEQGPATDVFATGIILWEAATGRHPFWTTATSQEHLLRVASEHLEAPPRPPDMAPELYQVLTRCMQPAVQDRPADGGALISLMSSSPSALSLSSSSSSASLPLPSPPPPRRRPLMLALASALVLAVALGLSALGPPQAPPATLPAAPPLLPPTVRCLLDGIELTLPAPPPPGTTARLSTPSGEILVQRSMREPRIVLRSPSDATGPLRWALHGGGAFVEGTATAGPRLLFDASTVVSDLGRKDVVVAHEPLVLGNRIVLTVTPTSVLVLEPRRPPGGATTLELAVAHTVERRPRPTRAPARAFAGRLHSSAAALVPRGRDSVAVLPFGLPASTLLLPLVPGRPPTATTRPDLDLVDALALRRPGGGSVTVEDVVPRDGGVGGRRVVVTFRDDDGTARGRALSLTGRTPLGAAFLDPDRLLLARVDGDGVVASVIAVRDGEPSVVGSRPLGLEPPGWRDDLTTFGTGLSGGRAALAVGSLLVVARTDGNLVVRPLDPGPQGGVGGMVEDGPDALVVVMNRLTSPLATGGSVEAQRVSLGGEDAVPPPVRIRQTSERIDEVLPLGLLPSPGGGFLLYSTGLLVDCEGPPAYRWRSSVRIDGLAGWMTAHEGTVYVTTTKGRIFGFDLPGGAP